jgi:hypothetical protein
MGRDKCGSQCNDDTTISLHSTPKTSLSTSAFEDQIICSSSRVRGFFAGPAKEDTTAVVMRRTAMMAIRPSMGNSLH